MKSFRTIVPEYAAAFTLTHADRLMLLGSCFTEHIGGRLVDGKFSTLLNPNGIIYNPWSLARSLQALFWGEFSRNPEEGSPYFEYQGLWHSWDHHGAFSHPDREIFLQQIEFSRLRAADFLKKSNRLLLTLGTAEVFSLRENGRMVANNHKAPASWFEQRRLSVAETVEALTGVLAPLKILRPEMQVLLSVSPVRHLRNGFVENQRSKAVLVLACAELCAHFDFVHYFPAYELLLDDLRDYRFYAEDMVHPSKQAVDYIWDYFASAFFPGTTQDLLQQINAITTAASHRPFRPDNPDYITFAKRQLGAIAQLRERYPDFDFSTEMEWFQQFSA